MKIFGCFSQVSRWPSLSSELQLKLTPAQCPYNQFFGILFSKKWKIIFRSGKFQTAFSGMIKNFSFTVNNAYFRINVLTVLCRLEPD